MKKCFLLLMVMVLMTGCLAHAETDAAYGAWMMEAADIEVTVDGETVALNPTLLLRLGMTENLSNAYLTVEICRDDEVLAGFWAEEENGGKARYALSASETCGLVDPGYYLHFMFIMPFLAEDYDTEDVIQLSYALNMANALFGDKEQLAQLLQALGTVETTDDGAYRCSADIDGVAVSATLALRWEPTADKPFDLSQLREVPFTARTGIMATEGFMEAEEQMSMALMLDPSVLKLITVLMPMMGAE